MRQPSARTWRWLVGGAWAALVAVAGIVLAASERTPAELMIAVTGFLVDHPLGPAWFVLACLVRPFTGFPAVGITAIAGNLYGPWFGLALVLVGVNGGTVLAYGLARWLGAGVARRALGHPRLRGVTGLLRRNAFTAVMTLRLAGAPYDGVSFLAGVLRLRPAPFVLGTALGTLPAIVTFLLFGASVGSLAALAEGRWPGLEPWGLGASLALLAAGLLVSRWLRRRHPSTEPAPG